MPPSKQPTSKPNQTNEFTGPIPDLSYCFYLIELRLDYNFLTGGVPPSLAGLSRLQHLSLKNNLLKGPLPVFGDDDVFTNLYPINRLCPHTYDGLCDQMILLDFAEAYGNPVQLTNSLEWKSSCQGWSFIVCEGKVIDVKLARQGLTGTISHEFANLTNLRNLDLSGNNLWGSIPEILTTLPQLEALDVSYNNLSSGSQISNDGEVKYYRQCFASKF